MKPVIGITPSFSTEDNLLQLNNAYARAIFLSGGFPVILSYTKEDIEETLLHVDGLIFSGGGDVDPLLFGEEPQIGLGRITPERDREELALCRAALCKNIPMLGICRGMQLLSLAEGGSIFQDLSSSFHPLLKHSQTAPKYHPTHTVRLCEGSRLFHIFGQPDLKVNSFHHQAVHLAGHSFSAAAHSPDGVIEAIEHKTNPFAVGVQWHPECMYEKEKNQLLLFSALVREAEK